MVLSLEKYTMLDLSRTFPGPTCSHILADLGMNVIKVEEPDPRYGVGRDTFMPPDPTPEDEVRLAAHNALARNKKSIALQLLDPNLRPECQEVFYRLAEKADVVLDGYRPGAVEWMGVDYESVRKHNPRIIYCSLSGFGHDGPYMKYPAHDPNFVALASAVRRDVDGRPVPNVTSLGDINGGMYGALSILAALVNRENTGEGQYIDVSVSAAAMALMIRPAVWHTRGDPPQPPAPAQGGPPNVSSLKCKDGKWLSTGNSESIFWRNFCNVLGHPEWIPLRGASAAERDQMVRDCQDLFLTKNRNEWLDILHEAETCAMPINDIGEALEDPQMRHIGMAWDMPHPKFGTITQLGFPVRFNGEPVKPGAFAPVLGEHTVDILSSFGFSHSEIDDLENRKIVKLWKGVS